MIWIINYYWLIVNELLSQWWLIYMTVNFMSLFIYSLFFLHKMYPFCQALFIVQDGRPTWVANSVSDTRPYLAASAETQAISNCQGFQKTCMYQFRDIGLNLSITKTVTVWNTISIRKLEYPGSQRQSISNVAFVLATAWDAFQQDALRHQDMEKWYIRVLQPLHWMPAEGSAAEDWVELSLCSEILSKPVKPKGPHFHYSKVMVPDIVFWFAFLCHRFLVLFDELST